MALRLAGEPETGVQGLDGESWLRQITSSDTSPGLRIVQSGAAEALLVDRATQGAVLRVNNSFTQSFGSGPVTLQEWANRRTGSVLVYASLVHPDNAGVYLDLGSYSGASAVKSRENLRLEAGTGANGVANADVEIIAKGTGRNVLTGRLSLTGLAAADVLATLKQAAAATGNILEGRSSGDALLFAVNKDGLLQTGGLHLVNALSVGTSQTPVAHGLSYTPQVVAIKMLTAGIIYESQAPDGTNIYLTADAAGRAAEVFVR